MVCGLLPTTFFQSGIYIFQRGKIPISHAIDSTPREMPGLIRPTHLAVKYLQCNYLSASFQPQLLRTVLSRVLESTHLQRDKVTPANYQLIMQGDAAILSEDESIFLSCSVVFCFTDTMTLFV